MTTAIDLPFTKRTLGNRLDVVVVDLLAPIGKKTIARQVSNCTRSAEFSWARFRSDE